MNLPPLIQAFVLHFGEMGQPLGHQPHRRPDLRPAVPSEEPLNAEDIVEPLGVSRSNVSMGLKELQAWNLVRLQHKPGDRRDYFSTPDDIWQIVRTLAEERKQARDRPDPDPAARGRSCKTPASAEERHAQERMQRDARPLRAAHRLVRRRADVSTPSASSSS